MSIRMFVSACLAAVSLCIIVVSLLLFQENWNDFRAARDAKALIGLLGASTRVTEGLAIERGATNVVLEGNASGRAALEQTRARTDAGLDTALALARDISLPEAVATVKALETIRATLRSWRDKADTFTPTSPEQRVQMRQDYAQAVYGVMNLASQTNAGIERRLLKLDADVASLAMMAGEGWVMRDLASRDSTFFIVALTSGQPVSARLTHDMTLSEGRIRQTWDRMVEKARASGSPEVLRDSVAKVEASYVTPVKALRERVIKAGQADGAYDLDATEWRRLTGPMMQSILVIRDAAIEEANRVAAISRDAAATALAWLGALLVVAMAVLVGVVIGIQRRLVVPLSHLTATIDVFAAGERDFVVPHAGRDDEIGRMAKAIDVLRLNAQEADHHARDEAAAAAARDLRRSQVETVTGRFVAGIDSVVGGVAGAVDRLRRSTGTLSATSAAATTECGVVANAATNASCNVQTVASAAEELSNSIQEISRRVAETARAMDGAVHQAERTNVTVRSLADAARKIGDVVNLITDIASQTNLLALNATIEAARAGEAGKGFAVVAGEVKHLANQTAKATGDIQSQVAEIQAETERAVEVIAAIVTTIATVNQYTIGIASAVEEQGAATQEIARNVQQAASSTSDVSVSIDRVLEAERATTAAASELSNLADCLAGESNRLKNEVGGFVSEVKTG